MKTKIRVLKAGGTIGINTSTTSGLLTIQGTGATLQNLLNITSSTGTSLLNVSFVLI